MQSAQGIFYLSQLAGESEFYADRKLDGKWEDTKNFEENKEIAKTELPIPNDIQKKLEAIYDIDPTLLYELAL